MADALVSHFVEQARDSGASWSSIGGTLGVTKQAAQQRWRGRPPVRVPLQEWTALDHPGPLGMFSTSARQAISRASAAARERGHGWVGPEHLFLGLLQEPEGLVNVMLRAIGEDPMAVGERAIETAEPAESAQLGGAGAPPGFSRAAKRILELSLWGARKFGEGPVGTGHLLLALLTEGKSVAARVLVGEGIDRRAVREALQMDHAV
jgi:hypothetical protein